MGKKVILFGGAGFIGHNSALKLNDLGFDVTVVDSLQINNIYYFESLNDKKNNSIYINMLEERRSLIKDSKINFIIQDLRDYHAVAKIITNIKPNIVVQLAAVAHANKSNKDPYSTFDHSFRTLENALDASKNNIDHFIYFSSSMVYGNFENPIVDETSNCEPLGIYAALKYGGEKLVVSYNQVFGLPYTIIRPSALYGERCVSGRVIQNFLEKAFNNEVLEVQGDGEDKLDFTYIDDLVDGITKVVCTDKPKNEVYNITYGSSRSINDVCKILKELFPNIEIVNKKRDKLMPFRGTLSIQKIKDSTLLHKTPYHTVQVLVDRRLIAIFPSYLMHTEYLE